MGTEFWKLSAVELAEGIRRRDFSSTEVVTSVLGRIRAENPRLNAITVDCSDDAMQDAERADAAVRRGEPLGALHGVPVTIKENADQRGKATPNGIPAFAKLIAPDDSPIVANLRRAGADHRRAHERTGILDARHH